MSVSKPQLRFTILGSLPESQFIYALLVLLLVLVLLNRAVAFMTRNSLPRRVMAHARDSSGTTALALGNSLIAAGFDEHAFNKAMGYGEKNGSANLGLGASTPVEQLLLLRYALQNRMHPQILVYGFYDFQLTSPVVLTTPDLVGNHAMLYYVEPEYARSFYSLSFHDRIEFELMRHLPIIAERGAIWAKVELLRRRMGQQGLPQQKTNTFGRASDFTLLEAASPDEFTEECIRSIGLDVSSPVREIIRQARDAGIRVIFVEMPMHPGHIRMFYNTLAWQRYHDRLRNILETQNVSYVDASTWISNESMFADHIHLTESGAGQFSTELAKYILAEVVPGRR